MADLKIRGKRVSVHADGHIFVDGKDTKLRQWSNGKDYSNMDGQKQTDVKGKSLEEALYIRGFLPR